MKLQSLTLICSSVLPSVTFSPPVAAVLCSEYASLKLRLEKINGASHTSRHSSNRLCIFSKPILIFLGGPPRILFTTALFVYGLIPQIFTNAVNFPIQKFLKAQSIVAPSAYISTMLSSGEKLLFCKKLFMFSEAKYRNNLMFATISYLSILREELTKFFVFILRV
ncbi:hypothetical protein GLYMA_02G158350v4 [Glycine max]|nr:hypothetical protein GLYMA_02G158350v4 [Glycine max]KAH1060566.1 hypothetical protein GYH30_004164 [Glycine max]